MKQLTVEQRESLLIARKALKNAWLEVYQCDKNFDHKLHAIRNDIDDLENRLDEILETEEY